MIYVYADGYVGLHAYPTRDDYFTITDDYAGRVGELHCLLTKHFGDTRQRDEVYAEALELLELGDSLSD
ncbi:MAG TPA: hypothetical protein PL000_22570 [Anaerolineales bacterium]|nr:hypothetical protein [Anaerolineales bacterium]